MVGGMPGGGGTGLISVRRNLLSFLAHLWHIYGTSMAHLWHRNGTGMAHLWHNSYGTMLAQQWHIFGTSMAHLWHRIFHIPSVMKNQICHFAINLEGM